VTARPWRLRPRDPQQAELGAGWTTRHRCRPGSPALLAAPGPAAGLIEDLAPAAASPIRAIPHGSIAVVSLGYRLDQFPEPPVGHGFLVAAGEPLSIEACTWSSLKWAGRAPDGAILLRAFAGSRREQLLDRSDTEIVAAVERDLALTMGVRSTPVMTRVARWSGQMPHYTVGHLDRVSGAFAALAGTPNLVLAGAAYRGVGLPDCIAQGRAAAARVIDVRERSPDCAGRPSPDSGRPSR
jgi:protoporphyrinogen/coproporphyrinogen III oxidase